MTKTSTYHIKNNKSEYEKNHLIKKKTNDNINLKKELEKTLFKSKDQTKKNRHIIISENLKNNKCEKYQIKQIKNIFKIKKNIKIDNLKSTNLRINKETNMLEKTRTIKNIEHGLFLSEDFDGQLKYNNKNILFNLKYCVGSGGSQNRTLKLTNLFIFDQCKYLKNNNCDKYIFINIIDGDTFYSFEKQINYLKDNHCKNFKKNIFIGNMHDFYYSSFINEL